MWFAVKRLFLGLTLIAAAAAVLLATDVRRSGPPERPRIAILQHASLPVLDEARFARLEAALLRGPAAHGWDDQYWTLARIQRVIGRMFHPTCSLPGVWKLLRRHDRSCRVPARRAVERDEGAIVVWKSEVWPAVERPRRTWTPGSASKVSAAGR